MSLFVSEGVITRNFRPPWSFFWSQLLVAAFTSWVFLNQRFTSSSIPGSSILESISEFPISDRQFQIVDSKIVNFWIVNLQIFNFQMFTFQIVSFQIFN